MQFGVYGAYQLPRRTGNLIDGTITAKKAFWADVNAQVEGLPEACGCYIFAAQNRPWYVGLSSKQSFQAECLTPHKLNIYNNVLADYARAAPWMYFIAKLTPTGYFASPSANGHRDIAFLEKALIGLSITRNPEVSNIKGTKFLREMNVPGLINSGPGQGNGYAVKEIRSLFGVK